MTDLNELAGAVLSGDVPVADALKLIANEHDDERKALLQLVSAMAAYPMATGLSHAMGLLIIDAMRWRAFVSSDRISVLGTGGRGARMHIGLEIWGLHPNRPGLLPTTESARKLLTKYADDRRKEGYR